MGTGAWLVLMAMAGRNGVANDMASESGRYFTSCLVLFDKIIPYINQLYINENNMPSKQKNSVDA